MTRGAVPADGCPSSRWQFTLTGTGLASALRDPLGEKCLCVRVGCSPSWLLLREPAPPIRTPDPVATRCLPVNRVLHR